MKRIFVVLLTVSFLPVAAFSLLKNPNSLAFDQNGNLYVLSGQVINKYDIKGKFVRRLDSGKAARDDGRLIEEKFFYPEYIGPGPSGSLSVLGYGYWSKHGRDRVGVIDSGDGHLVLSFGEYSKEDKPYGFYEPLAVAADSEGNIYVANQGAYGIKKFDRAGRFVGQWGKRGGGNGEFEAPVAIAVDNRNDEVYVADDYSTWDRPPQMRVQKFTKDGKFIKKFGEHFGVDWRPLGWLPVFFPSLTNIPDINYPAGIAVDGKGFVYVVEQGKSRINKYDRGGKLVLSFGGERGDGPGQFNMQGVRGWPVGIAVDGANNVYVCDEGNDRVQKFDENGKFLMEIK